MALVTLNGDIRVISLELHRPRTGQWSALAELDSDVAPTGPVTVTLGETYSLTGRVERSGVFAGRVRAKLVGGLGDFSTVLPPWPYQRAPARTIVGDILRAITGKLASTSAPLDTKLPWWTRTQGEARDALSAITSHLGLLWRVLPDGSIYVGPETWPVLDIEHTVVEDDDSDRRMIIATEEQTLTGGVVLDGNRVSDVVSRYEAGSVRHEVWLET